MIFLALCCDLGLFAKRLIAPVTNMITDSLHIPGGIGSSFSLMFLVVAALLLPCFGVGTLMGFLQSILAFSLGMAGSMGALAPVGYLVPGFAIDCVCTLCRKAGLPTALTALPANMAAAAAACLTANALVFRLRGVVLGLYVSVALTSGAVCGLLAGKLIPRLKPIIQLEKKKGKTSYETA